MATPRLLPIHLLRDNVINRACIIISSESLYASGISSKYSSTPPPPRSSRSQPPPDTYRFSTFGYNAPVDASTMLPYPMYATMQPSHTTHLPCRDSRCDSVTHTIDITPTSTVIDNYEYSRNSGNGGTVLPVTGLPMSTPTPPSSIHMRNFNTSAPRKMEESCIMLEIRNSAPDVIIMTSH